MMLLRSGVSRSRSRHGTPRSSSARRTVTTPSRSRINRGSPRLRSSGVVMPIAVEPRRQPAGDAPQIGQLEARQRLILRRFVEQQHTPRHVSHPSSRCDWRPWRASWSARCRPTPECRSIAAPRRAARAHALRAARRSRPAEKGFVDRIDFEIGREVAQHLHHPRAHIAIERVIARPHDDAGGSRICSRCRCHGAPMAMPSALASLLRAITQPSLFDSTTTGLPRSSRLKHALARDVEIVAVDEGDRAAHGHSMRMLRVMTPHTSKRCPSDDRMSAKAGFSACSHDRAVLDPVALDGECAVEQRQHDAAVDGRRARDRRRRCRRERSRRRSCSRPRCGWRRWRPDARSAVR